MASIYLDIGSTNARGWLVDRGQILSAASVPVGVRDTVVSGSTSRVRAAARDLVEQLSAAASPDRVVAAGMITSSMGVSEVPHVPAPAGPDDLARSARVVAAPDISNLPLLLVPGVRTPHEDVLQSDVMRGEETLVLGLLARGGITAGDRVLNAGSHWKLVATDHRGRVASSLTSMGGEILHAVRSGTVIGASLTREVPLHWDLSWVSAGAAAARDHGLLRAFFCVRLLDQAGQTDAVDRHSFLVGAAVGHDLDALRTQGRLDGPGRVCVTGNASLARAWQHLLAASGIDAVALDPDAVAAATVAGLNIIEDAWRKQTAVGS